MDILIFLLLVMSCFLFGFVGFVVVCWWVIFVWLVVFYVWLGFVCFYFVCFYFVCLFVLKDCGLPFRYRAHHCA